MSFVRVLLVDGHTLVTEALTARLSSAADMWVVGSCGTDNPRLPQLVGSLHPDVVVTEVGPAPADTGALVRLLLTARPEARVVVLTGCRDTAHAVAAAREGAQAWVPKESSVDQLLAVLRAVCLGHAFYPPRQLGAVLRVLREDARTARYHSDRLSVLSERELDVLRRLAEGKPVHQIAGEALVSPNTVRSHVRSILAKLGVHSRLEAVSVARGAGLTTATR